MLKISKRDQKLLLNFFGILCFVVSIIWVYQPLNEKTKQLQESNEKKQQELNKLKKWEKNEAYYLEEIEHLKQEVINYENQFPSEILEEDTILLSRTLEKNMDMDVQVIQLNPKEVVYTTEPMDTTKEEEEKTLSQQNEEITQEKIDEIEGNTQEEAIQEQYVGDGKALYRTRGTLQFTVSYQGLKDMITYIKGLERRVTMDSIRLDYNETQGNLSGEVVLNQFTLEGSDKQYQTPDAGNNTLGLNNIFGTFEKKTKKK